MPSWHVISIVFSHLHETSQEFEVLLVLQITHMLTGYFSLFSHMCAFGKSCVVKNCFLLWVCVDKGRSDSYQRQLLFIVLFGCQSFQALHINLAHRWGLLCYASMKELIHFQNLTPSTSLCGSLKKFLIILILIAWWTEFLRMGLGWTWPIVVSAMYCVGLERRPTLHWDL